MLHKTVHLPGGSTLAVQSEFVGVQALPQEVAQGHRTAQLGVSTARCVEEPLATKSQVQMVSLLTLLIKLMWMELV